MEFYKLEQKTIVKGFFGNLQFFKIEMEERMGKDAVSAVSCG